MSDLENFLHSQAAGVEAEEGGFTLNPQALRKKMLASVPPVPNAGGHMLAHLRAAARLAGLSLNPEGSTSTVYWKQNTYYPVVYDGPVSEGCLLTPERVERNFREPFQSTDPLDLCLSRAFLWAESLAVTVQWEWRDPHGGHLTSLESGELNTRALPRAKKHLMRISAFEKRHFMGTIFQRAREVEVARGWGRESPFERIPGRSLHSAPHRRHPLMTEAPLYPFFQEQGYFDYRSSRVMLMDKVLPCQESESPHLALRTPPQSWWSRFRLAADPNQLPICYSKCARSEQCRGVISLRLTDRPGVLQFSDWFPHVEVSPPFSLPPGILVTAVWPGLLTDTWGQGLQVNEAYQSAMAWVEKEIACFLDELRGCSDEIIPLLGKHTKTAYREEVVDKVKALWDLG